MKKVLLAVGHIPLEEFIQKKLKNEFMFVGVATYRDSIIRQIGQTLPDIIVIRQTLHGNENILDIVYEIRTKFHDVRIVFVAGKCEPGDELLATLVNYGVYDILYGEKIPSNEIIRLLRNPNGYKDVQHLQPKPVLDERKNKVLFERPDFQPLGREIVKEIIVKEVFIDSHKGVEDTTVKTTLHPPLSKDEKVQASEKTLESVKLEKEVPKESTDDSSETQPASETSVETQKVVVEPVKKADEPKEKNGLFNKWFGSKGGEDRLKQEYFSDSGKQKIITFIGSKTGVGNTSLALNTAVQLSQKKKRVIYIEMNDRTPAVNYWFELGRLDEGIDSALKALETKQFEKIKEAIVCTSDLIEKNSTLQSNYKKFPKTLDFMFFSNRYLTRKAEDEIDGNLSLTKELYLFLLFQLEYDFIVLDVVPDLENIATMNALMYSNQTVITASQDVSAIGNAVYMLNEMNKNGIPISKKMQFVVNRFEKAELDVKEIAEWVQVEEILTVPCFNKEFINANFVGMPILLHSKNPQVKSVFQKIEKKIL